MEDFHSFLFIRWSCFIRCSNYNLQFSYPTRVWLLCDVVWNKLDQGLATKHLILQKRATHEIIDWFSNRRGTSVDDGALKSDNWLDQWQSGKLSTGSRVWSFPSAFPSSTDVPVLLLNQPSKEGPILLNQPSLILSWPTITFQCYDVRSAQIRREDLALRWRKHF